MSLPVPAAAAWDGALDLADGARGRLLRSVGRPLRGLLIDREARVAATGTLLIGVALASAATFPLWMLAVAPFIWGVPHLLADLRYLVVRQGLQRRWWLLGALAVAVGAAASGLGVRASLPVAFGLACIVPGPWRRRVPLLLALGGGTALALRAGPAADVALAHLHNLAALAYWWAWRDRDRWLHLLPVAAFVLGGVFLLSGGAGPILAASGGLAAPADALSLDALAWTLAPVANAELAERLVLFYAFAQGVHYVAWLHLVPQEDRARPVGRSFRRSWQALRVDLGPWLLTAALLAGIGLAAWALVDLTEARNRYFQLAFFHAHMELLIWPVLALRGLRSAAGA